MDGLVRKSNLLGGINQHIRSSVRHILRQWEGSARFPPNSHGRWKTAPPGVPADGREINTTKDNNYVNHEPGRAERRRVSSALRGRRHRVPRRRVGADRGDTAILADEARHRASPPHGRGGGGGADLPAAPRRLHARRLRLGHARPSRQGLGDDPRAPPGRRPRARGRLLKRRRRGGPSRVRPSSPSLSPPR